MERAVTRGSSGAAPVPASTASCRRPLVVVVMGLRGAGKSTVALALERELGLRRVCRDAIRDAMFPRCDYSFVEQRAAFRTVLLAVEINCLLGASTVVDGMTFARRQDFDQLAALAAAHGADVLPLLVECPPALARSRLMLAAARGFRPGAELPGRAASVLAPPDPPSSALRVDGTRPAAETCRLAVAEVAARLAPASAGA
ncbi:MAG TPA: AAA family ATPase [Dokdonella sp.]